MIVGLLGGLIFALVAFGISALRKRYPAAMTIIIRTILGLIFAAMISVIILELIFLR